MAYLTHELSIAILKLGLQSLDLVGLQKFTSRKGYF